ncbi:hypothetical protein BH18ACT4_BH18ACT4_00600 [soil metagenome]
MATETSDDVEPSGPSTTAPQGGLLVWTAVLIGIGAWMTHVAAQSSLAQFVCTRHEYEWVLHAITVATVLPVLAGMAFCYRLVRSSPDGEEVGSALGRNHFLGLFGLLVGAINVALILLEGTYAVFIDPCA